MPTWTGNPIATTPGQGDAHRNSVGGGSSNVTLHYWGTWVSGKTTVNDWTYWRFEPDIPAGSTIDGMSFSLTSAAAGQGTAQNRGRIGLLIPDGTWELAAGFAGYTPPSYPLHTTNANWYGGAPTISGANWQPQTITGAGQECGFWDGTGTVLWQEVPGMIGAIEGYLADNEALRGTGVGAGIPLLIGVSSTGTVGIWNHRTYTRDDVTSSNWPELTIEYTLPPESGLLSVRAASSQVVRARAKTSLAASSRPAPSTAASGRISSSQVVSGRAATAPVIRGRVRNA